MAAGPSSATDLEKMMTELGLQEDDMDDVVVDEAAVPKEAARWRAVARVHIEKPYLTVRFIDVNSSHCPPPCGFLRD